MTDGIPVDQYGEEYTPDGDAEIQGWGGLDGAAVEWRAPSGAYSVLVPTIER